MSERYSRLFTLPENLYAVGSPVVIAAGTLLKDNQTGKIVAQLKLRSISFKMIIGVKVRLCLFDNAGNPISVPVDYDYLDLSASRDEEFGQKTPVMIAEKKARSYAVAVQKVVFADKTTWATSDAPWEPLPRQKTLDAVFSDPELVKQYRIAIESNFSYYPLQEKDLWYCACGAWNHEGENCHRCHRTLFELQTIDTEQLIQDKDARLVQEREAAEAKAAAERAAVEAAKKKTLKFLKIAIPIFCVCLAILIFVNSVIIPNRKYHDAVDLMAAEEYEEAIAIFSALDGYKDSGEQIRLAKERLEEIKWAAEAEATYNDALHHLKNGKNEKAYELFKSLGEYKDSLDYLNRFQSKRTHVKYTIPDTKYYNYKVDITYNASGEIETKTKEYYQTGAKGYIQEAFYDYEYNDDGYILSIEFNYPKSSKSNYSNTTLVGEKYFYDKEDRLIEYQQIQHDGGIIRDYYLWLNESGQLIAGGIGKVDLKYRDQCHIHMVDSSGNKIKCWNEKYDADGNLSGEPFKEIGYKYDADGQLIEEIQYSEEAHYSSKDGKVIYEKTEEITYYTYKDGKLISERLGDTTINYDYNDFGEEVKSIREQDGNVLSTLESTYTMVYVSDTPIKP